MPIHCADFYIEHYEITNLPEISTPEGSQVNFHHIGLIRIISEVFAASEPEFFFYGRSWYTFNLCAVLQKLCDRLSFLKAYHLIRVAD
jgi:hypothetical protein